MILNSFSILNYKNIAEASLSFSEKVNCLLGNNGMGKTNILDAIYYLSFCKSCISSNDLNTVRHGEDYMMLQGEYLRNEKVESISCSILKSKKKVVKRNGKEYRKLSEHIGLLPLVMVSPQDWDMITGGSEERRRLIDRIISQNDTEYLNNLIRYNKALEQRNAMLKQGYQDQLLFESIDELISISAQNIYETRKDWVVRFTPIFMKYYNTIGNCAEEVRLNYKSDLMQGDMLGILRANFERDKILGYTSQGVHRDDIDLLLNDELMRKIGSQGQCKTYTIAMRFAQYEFLKQESGITPILLLDDIFDKLDAMRVSNIMKIVSDTSFGQIFISDTNRQHINEIIETIGSDFKIFLVEDGCCKEYTHDEI